MHIHVHACGCVRLSCMCIYIVYIQYASKKLPINGPFNSATVPVQIPFKTRTNHVRVSRFQRPVLIPVLTAVQTAVSCLCDGSSPSAARARQYARVVQSR